MYCNFYGLKEKPFNVTSDPAFFFLSRQHKDALAHLVYGATQRKGIIVLTGEIGTGKTTLCRFFLDNLDKKTRTAFIMNPYFSEIQLLEAILDDFGIAKGTDKTRLSLTQKLNKFLLDRTRAGCNIVLIIDEAQNLPPHLLEEIRLLSNLETEKEKLLQVVLVGQPELNPRLGLYELRQLRQRVMVNYHITPLEHDEIKAYITHRLSVAGAGSHIDFHPQAIELVFGFSKGTPRLINILCDRALLAGFVDETTKIGPEIIDRCIQELSLHSQETSTNEHHK